MTNVDLLNALQGKRARAFNHANSVRTSCSFLQKGALLSRAYIQNHSLSQTPQPSDAIDQQFGIWNEIFLDAVDIHARARRNNHYGPVLFVLNMESILRDNSMQGAVRVTRENPIYWKAGQTEAERYFETTEQFSSEYNLGDFGRMFTIRLGDGRLPLGPHLSTIVLDDPHIKSNGDDAYTIAQEALLEAARIGGLEVKIIRRQCSDNCKCATTYQNGWRSLKGLFEA